MYEYTNFPIRCQHNAVVSGIISCMIYFIRHDERISGIYTPVHEKVRRDVRSGEGKTVVGAAGGGRARRHEAAGAQHRRGGVRRHQEAQVHSTVPSPVHHLPVSVKRRSRRRAFDFDSETNPSRDVTRGGAWR